VGPGKLLATSFDLINSLDARPAARQLRYSLLHYAASAEFKPAVELPSEVLDKIFAAGNAE
jgi:hypothetical protein